MPITNAKRNATPTRKIEYGSVRPITSLTGDGKFEVEIPKSPCRSCPRYVMYPWSSGSFWNPSESRRFWIAFGLAASWAGESRASIPSIGSPGISRGSR